MTREARQDGFGLVQAIFILVVMASVGALMVTISGAQRNTGSMGILGARAYQAGASGVQWGIYQALTGGSCPATTTLSLTEGGLAGFSVGVSCASTQHQESGTTLTVYELVATASYGSLGDQDYARRVLRGSVTNAP